MLIEALKMLTFQTPQKNALNLKGQSSWPDVLVTVHTHVFKDNPKCVHSIKRGQGRVSINGLTQTLCCSQADKGLL